MFRVSHECSAFNGRGALVTLKSRAGRFRQAACQPSKRYNRLARLFQMPLRQQGDTSKVKEARETRRRIAKLRVTWPSLSFSPSDRGRDGEGVLPLGYSERVN